MNDVCEILNADAPRAHSAYPDPPERPAGGPREALFDPTDPERSFDGPTIEGCRRRRRRRRSNRFLLPVWSGFFSFYSLFTHTT